MRARLAIAHAGVTVALREIELRNKPRPMLEASPKGTVPVLVLPTGQVIEESLDIMLWALRLNDPGDWLSAWQQADIQSLIQESDGEFKYHLDRYKYADRYPEHGRLHYRRHGERFLADLEERLRHQPYLAGAEFSIADAAIAPFIRQFAAVDGQWFADAPYPALRQWLAAFLSSELFHTIMIVYQPWKLGDDDVTFGLPASKCSN